MIIYNFVINLVINMTICDWSKIKFLIQQLYLKTTQSFFFKKMNYKLWANFKIYWKYDNKIKPLKTYRLRVCLRGLKLITLLLKSFLFKMMVFDID